MKFVQKLVGIVSVSICTLGVVSANAAKESLEDRIKPVGEVCMAGDPCAAAAVVASAEPRSGEAVYSSKCFTCHATGAAGAPKLGDTADWEARISARGKDGLYAGAINGYNAMPAKGLCMDCSDDEIKAAVDYMLEN